MYFKEAAMYVISHFSLYIIFLMFFFKKFHCVLSVNNCCMIYFKIYMNVTGTIFNLSNPTPFQYENGVN